MYGIINKQITIQIIHCLSNLQLSITKMSETNNESVYTSLMSSFDDMLSRFKGMSWIEITWLVEEEEEAELALAKEKEMRDLAEKRKELLTKGEYELEEGEILE